MTSGARGLGTAVPETDVIHCRSVRLIIRRCGSSRDGAQHRTQLNSTSAPG